jgi:hypothetical protein
VKKFSLKQHSKNEEKMIVQKNDRWANGITTRCTVFDERVIPPINHLGSPSPGAPEVGPQKIAVLLSESFLVFFEEFLFVLPLTGK